MLYGAQMSRRWRAASQEHTTSAEPQAHLTELDELAGEPRDVGQLAEPLADSVLDYTLRRLRPNSNAESNVVEVLEKAPIPDELSQLMDTDSIVPPRDPSSQPTGGVQLPTVARDEQNYGSFTVPQVPGYWDRTRASGLPPVDIDGLDWWEASLENIQEPILSYDELFNLDFTLS